MIELSLLGLVVVGYAGSVYWTGYLRALGQAADLCHNNRRDLAMNKLKTAALLPPLGRLVDQWALCLNFQSYLYIQQNQPEWAEKRLKQIDRRSGISEAIRSLGFYRRAELNELRGLPNEARACRQQALEKFEAGKEELESRELWKPLALALYGMGDYSGAADALERVLTKEWTAPLLFLRWLILERIPASKKARLAACREALEYERLPARRACLLAGAAEAQMESNPESALEAARACLEEQRRLGNAAKPDITVVAISTELGALSRLDRELEYQTTRERFLTAIRPDEPTYLYLLGEILMRERRFLEYLRLTESVDEPSVRAQRAFSLYHLGRPKDALLCIPGHEQWGQAGLEADCYLYQLDRPGADRAVEGMRVANETGYLTWRASKASIWDGDVALAQELWPHPYPDSTLLMYQGRFRECWEAWSQQHENSILAPSAKTQTRLFYEAVVWMYEERWGEALQNLDRLVSCCDQDPKMQDYSALYALSCRCWMEEDKLEELEDLSGVLRARYSQAPLVQLDITLSRVDALIAVEHHEQALKLIQTALVEEPRAFYLGFLMDLRSTALRSLGRVAEAEEQDQVIPRTAPGSFWMERASVRMQRPPG